MSLDTGRRIHRRDWTSVPMTNEVIARVERMGKHEGQPALLVFTDKCGMEFMDGYGAVDDDGLSYTSEHSENQEQLAGVSEEVDDMVGLSEDEQLENKTDIEEDDDLELASEDEDPVESSVPEVA